MIFGVEHCGLGMPEAKKLELRVMHVAMEDPIS
jgi:hypothetical protein